MWFIIKPQPGPGNLSNREQSLVKLMTWTKSGREEMIKLNVWTHAFKCGTCLELILEIRSKVVNRSPSKCWKNKAQDNWRACINLHSFAYQISQLLWGNKHSIWLVTMMVRIAKNVNCYNRVVRCICATYVNTAWVKPHLFFFLHVTHIKRRQDWTFRPIILISLATVVPHCPAVPLLYNNNVHACG